MTEEKQTYDRRAVAYIDGERLNVSIGRPTDYSFESDIQCCFCGDVERLQLIDCNSDYDGQYWCRSCRYHEWRRVYG